MTTTPSQKVMYKFYELKALRATGNENFCHITDYAKEGYLTVADLKSLLRLQKSFNIASYQLLESLEKRTATPAAAAATQPDSTTAESLQVGP